MLLVVWYLDPEVLSEFLRNLCEILVRKLEGITRPRCGMDCKMGQCGRIHVAENRDK